MSEVTILATGLGFPEGPVVCADGSVVLTEIRNNKCSRITPDGKVSVFSECGGGPNGLAIGPDGFFYLSEFGQHDRAVAPAPTPCPLARLLDQRLDQRFQLAAVDRHGRARWTGVRWTGWRGDCDDNLPR